MSIRLHVSRARVFGLLALGAWLCSPAARAQQDMASAPRSALKIGAVAFWLWVGPSVNSSFTGPSFFLKDGVLSLKDYNSLGKGSAVLWAGPMGVAPLTFTVKAAERSEEVDDASGLPLWSYAYDPPALTLAMTMPLQPDLRRTGTLTDAEGRILWAGALALSHNSQAMPTHTGITTAARGWFRYRYGAGSATLLDVMGHTLWSGQPVGNVGVLVKDPQERGFQETIGAPGPALPPGKALTLTLSAQPGTVTLQDENHRALEVEPITLGRYSAASNNKDANRFFDAEVNSPQMLVPDVHAALPPGFAGTVYLVYQTADNAVVEMQRTTVTWGTPFRAADGSAKAHMEKKTATIDASGRETGGGSMSGDELLTYSP